MLKFKNNTIGNENSLCLNAEQVHGKIPICFNSSLNSCRDLHFLNFIGRLFQKTLPLKFNKFIPYFFVFAFGIKRIHLLSEYWIFFSLYVFDMKLGLSSFLNLYVLMAWNCKCFW